jgi:putative flippase GtrA
MNPWRRFVRFNAVGALGIGVQLGVVWLLADVGAVNTVPATVAAVVAAVVHNFLWHRRWTWADRLAGGARSPQAFARFALVNGAVSLIGNAAAVPLFTGGLGLGPVTANAIAIGLLGVVNFVLGDQLVFKICGVRS